MSDRRSASGHVKPAAETNGRPKPAPEPESIGFMEYFSTAHRYTPVRRGDLLGILEMLEFHRRQSAWWRRLVRWFFRIPGPSDLPTDMAKRFYRDVVRPQLKAQEAKIERGAEGGM